MKIKKTNKTVLVNKIDNKPKPKSQPAIAKSIIEKLQNQKPNIKLLDLIHNKKFCVVGNSPKELNSGNGKIIDSYDIVIRFKNYNITDEFIKDYGAKTDVWATPFNLTQFYRDPAQYKSICCCLPLTHPRWQKRFPTTNINYELVKTFSVDNFFNDSGGGPANMEQLFTESLKEYYQRNTQLELVRSNGDLQFSGAIKSYTLTPQAAVSSGDPNVPDRAEQMRLTISVEVDYINLTNEEENLKRSFSLKTII